MGIYVIRMRKLYIGDKGICIIQRQFIFQDWVIKALSSPLSI